MAFQSKSLSGYNKISLSQLETALKFLPDLVQSLHESGSLAEGNVNIVDYGCSEGKNSIITFYKILEEYRKTSSKPISILHVDLPDNNWSLVNEAMNSSEESYLSLSNIYPSTLGRSFFYQVVPNNTVHMAYSSFALHYLSKKAQREDGEYGWAFKANKAQGYEDMTFIITLRLNELVVGGTLNMIIAAREGENDPDYARYNIGCVKNLLDKGIITNEEFKNYAWHSYPYNAHEILEILSRFGDKIEVIKCEYGKKHYVYYEEYLETHDLELYKTKIVNAIKVLMKNPLLTCLNREDSEKEKILDIAVEELASILDKDTNELHQDYLIVIIKKKY
jgi:SAM dependent carboxyl methyltransferase